jgi:ABC-type amino acid transport substrate-binding protein
LKIVLGIALVLVLTGCSAEEPTQGVLRVCLGQSDPPRAQESPFEGLDVDVARFLADGLNRELQPVWLATPNPTEIESTDIDYGPLLTGRCDVQMSIPGVDALGAFAPRLVLTQPYYGAGFELVPAAANIEFDAPGDHRIAVRGNTVAHVVIDRFGFDWTMRDDSVDIVAAVASGEAEAGLVWGPDLAAVEMSRNLEYEPPAVLRWNHHVATRAADTALRDAINAVLVRAVVRDEILNSMFRHGVPARRPFATVHSSEMLRRQ